MKWHPWFAHQENYYLMTMEEAIGIHCVFVHDIFQLHLFTPKHCLLWIKLFFIIPLVMELAGPNYRTIVGAGMQLSYTLGFLVIPCLAYLLRDEFTLQLATMAPCVLFIPFVMWVISTSHIAYQVHYSYMCSVLSPPTHSVRCHRWSAFGWLVDRRRMATITMILDGSWMSRF